jgi:hypothetical protein
VGPSPKKPKTTLLTPRLLLVKNTETDIKGVAQTVAVIQWVSVSPPTRMQVEELWPFLAVSWHQERLALAAGRTKEAAA